MWCSDEHRYRFHPQNCAPMRYNTNTQINHPNANIFVLFHHILLATRLVCALKAAASVCSRAVDSTSSSILSPRSSTRSMLSSITVFTSSSSPCTLASASPALPALKSKILFAMTDPNLASSAIGGRYSADRTSRPCFRTNSRLASSRKANGTLLPSCVPAAQRK